MAPGNYDDPSLSQPDSLVNKVIDMMNTQPLGSKKIQKAIDKVLNPIGLDDCGELEEEYIGNTIMSLRN